MTLLSVKKIMKTNIVKKEGKTSVTEAAIHMREHNTDSILVTNGGGDVVGVITETDIVHKVVADRKDPDTVQLAQLKSHPVLHVESWESIFVAKQIMADNSVHHLLVKENGAIIGMLAARDLGN